MTDGPPPAAPPGWYPDPENPNTPHYWDGTAWLVLEPPTAAHSTHEQPAHLPAPATSRAARVLENILRQQAEFWLGLLAGILMIVGGLGTWATALNVVSVSGTHGDGWLVVGAGVVGIGSLWRTAMRRRLWLLLTAILAGVAGAAVAGIDLRKLERVGTAELFGRQLQIVHPGWGIYLAVGASIALAGFALGVLLVGPDEEGEEGGWSSATPAVFVVLVVAIGGTVAVAEIDKTSNGASAAKSEPATPATTTESTATTTSIAVANEAVEETLKEYSTAYSEKAPAKLEALFAEDLVRRDGTEAPENRARAIATYEKQFSQLQHPVYGLSETQITPEGSAATADAQYSIASQNGTARGTVSFHLVQREGHLSIDRINLEPNP